MNLFSCCQTVHEAAVLQLFASCAVRVKQVLPETLWHSDCFNTGRLYPQIVSRRKPVKHHRVRANPVESEGRQRYAVSEIPESGKPAEGVFDLEQVRLTSKLFLEH
ncbi:MAG TPA: hypothetical protein VEB70_03825 [Noviherbaspirillum sp.]|nr:hypothetical protein [Noviherbaspirillum sp.]